MIDDFQPSVKRTSEEPGKLDQIKDKQATLNQADAAGHSPLKADFDIDELSLDNDVAEDEEENKDNPAPGEGKKVPKANWLKRLKMKWPPGKKEWAATLIIVLVCGGITGFVLSHSGPKPVAEAAVIHTKAKPKPAVPTTVPSTLSGLPVTPAQNKLPVTAVMIENSDGARPQAGLSQAGVVFEAVAEGGITRFMALYQDQAPTNVGPIRSARPYYLQWALGFDAALAHVGGSPDALNDIQAWGVKDLNQMYHSSYYHRISTRQAPHNVYTGIPTLNQLEAAKGYTTSNFTGFERKPDSPAKVANAASINMNPSWSDYKVHYDYDSATNSYNRSEAGTPMVDSNTAKQLSPKVVIGLIIPQTQGQLDTTGAYYTVYQVVGSGQAYVFQDGTVEVGTWTKPSPTAQISFKDASGNTLKLNAGQTWITALGASNLLSYSP
ncbi:MAG TPA: DUF3048 domain-containing protein [Candidatus Saccharimonadales bacterium]|nr:DUF3048 domain-containing protein [Candidatus Saccharimonadales bacterium]